MDRVTLRRAQTRVARRIRWARDRRGVIGDDKLSPSASATAAVRRWRWRRRHGEPGRATPVWVVGVQRSGTNMLVRGFQLSPEFEVHNEDDGRAFRRFRLRPNDEVRELIVRSPHRYVLFKPLTDSHRVAGLLDEIDTPSPGRAIWIYRGVEGRVRSAVETFGTANLAILREISHGHALDSWQAAGLSENSLRLISRLVHPRLNAESAAALFWYVRNAIFFEHGLDRRPDVMLVSYDAFLRSPEATMRPLCTFLDLEYRPRLVEHIAPRTSRRPHAPLPIDPEIAKLCAELAARLDVASEEKVRRVAAV